MLALEDEPGVPIFERLPRGVLLSTARELLIHHLRTQGAELEKLKSQIADLAGERRGHVAIACSQAFLPYFLPEQIGAYRRDHSGVTFSARVRDREAAEAARVNHDSDLALIFEPVRLSEVQILGSARQVIHAVMAGDHPLIARDRVRLRDCATGCDCAAYPIGLPITHYGVRHLLDLALVKSPVTLRVVLDAGHFEFLRRYPMQEHLITFQIPIGLPETGHDGVISRPVDTHDVPEGRLYLCQLRGRTLPVAAAKFAAQIGKTLDARHD